MPGETKVYDMTVIRDLLLAAFTADDLRRLVLYTSRLTLKPLIHEFSSRDNLADMVERMTTFCYKRECLVDLLAEIKKANPGQYARFEARLAASDEPAGTSSPSGAPSAQDSRTVTYVTKIQHGSGIAIGDGAQVVTAPKQSGPAPRSCARAQSAPPSDPLALRRWLNQQFDDSGLDAFCQDFFPEVHDKFTVDLQKGKKITLLLDHCRRTPTNWHTLLAVLESQTR